MSAQPDSGNSYFPRLFAVARASVTQLVGSPSRAYRSEAARKLARQLLVTMVIGATSIVALMIWVDAWEITQMPPRGTASLWPVRILTDFGKDSYVLLALGVMFFVALLVAAAMKGPLRSRLLDIATRLQFLLLAVALPLAVGHLVKWIAGRGRPFVGGHANPFNFTPFVDTQAHASFPSAHAITAFALAFAITTAWPGARGVMVAYALVIATTRLVLLAHHPSDVLAGATIGIAGVMIVRYWFAERSLGFAILEGGRISSIGEGPRKRVAAEASAP
jgi:membrane-associated phospholipid phosphatase